MGRCALKATPGDGPLSSGYGLVLLVTGRIEEAAPHLHRAVALNPEGGSDRYLLGILYLVTGDCEAAIGELERARARAFPLAAAALSHAHHLNGDDERALETVIQTAPSLEVGAAWRRAFDEAGYLGLVRATLDYQISQSGRPCTNDPGVASSVFAIIGESDRMFECMGEGIRLKRPAFLAKVGLFFDPYRDDPHFTALLQRMNLAD